MAMRDVNPTINVEKLKITDKRHLLSHCILFQNKKTLACQKTLFTMYLHVSYLKKVVLFISLFNNHRTHKS